MGLVDDYGCFSGCVLHTLSERSGEDAVLRWQYPASEHRVVDEATLVLMEHSEFVAMDGGRTSARQWLRRFPDD